MAILNRAARNMRAMLRAAEWGDSSIPSNSDPGPLGRAAGGSAEAAALGISTVLSCVKALHDDQTVLPFWAYTGERHGARQPLRVQPRIITDPFGPDLDPAAGRGQLVVSTAMRGNGYAAVLSRDPDTALPDQLLVLHPDSVTPKRDPKRGKVFKIAGVSEPLGPDQMIHITGMMLPGAIEGVDVLTHARLTYELARKVAIYGESFFDGGGSPAGVISVKGSGDRKKAREVKEAWESSHGGVVNAHRPAVMFGDATWQAMTVSPENAQFLQTRRLLREDICGFYNVPLQRIQAIVDNASQGGGKGLDAIDAGYVKHGLLNAFGGIERAWSRMLAGDQASWAAYDFDGFLRADAKERAEVHQIYRVIGAELLDEVRADEGREPLPDGQGQDPFSPLNSSSTSTGGADNAPKPGNQGGASS